MALIVEFFGIPGVGKTTLCTALADELQARGVRVLNNVPLRELVNPRGAPRLGMALELLKLLATEPGASYKAARAILASGQESGADLRLALTSWFRNTVRIKKLAAADGVALFDQGLAQSIWQIYFAARQNTIAPVFHAGRHFPAIVFSIEASDQLIRQRVAGRESISRLDSQAKEDPEAFARARRTYELVLPLLNQLAEKKALIHQIVPNQDQPLRQTASELAETVLSQLQGQQS